MDTMGIVYPQYWMQVDIEVTFPQHLEVIKGFCCISCLCGQSKNDLVPLMVFAILLRWVKLVT
jgi:hypothetical protein